MVDSALKQSQWWLRGLSFVQLSVEPEEVGGVLACIRSMPFWLVKAVEGMCDWVLVMVNYYLGETGYQDLGLGSIRI